jgi:uncharacterized protein YbjT (DUF2867 family)
VTQHLDDAALHRSGMDVLVLGGGGGLGKLVCERVRARGHEPIPLGRRDGDLRNPDVIAARSAPLVINCAGASVALALGHGWRGYRAVDTPIGLAAVEAARRTKARLVYVGTHFAAAQRDCAYVDAHERVVTTMQDVDGFVVRATGFFSAFAALLPLARRGMLADIGRGHARTNAISERDLAEIVVDVALGGDGPREVTAGGPEVMTRREVFETVASFAGRRVRIAGLPVWMASIGATMTRILHPRMGQFMKFAVGLADHDVIAPSLGTTRLSDYLGARAQPLAA